MRRDSGPGGGVRCRQVGVRAAELGFYDWSGRSIERRRAEIRELLDYRECSLADQAAVSEWLVATVTQRQRGPELVRAEVLAWCREHWREPPTVARIDRLVRSALDRGEELLIERIFARLPAKVRERLNALVFGVPDEPDIDERGWASGMCWPRVPTVVCRRGGAGSTGWRWCCRRRSRMGVVCCAAITSPQTHSRGSWPRIPSTLTMILAGSAAPRLSR